MLRWSVIVPWEVFVLCAGCGSKTDAEPEPPASSLTDEITVFVSSTTHDAALGGLEAADARCAELAVSAGLSGSFKAWLSTASEPVAARFTRREVPYVRTDGVSIADGWADLVDGSLSAPISIDERMASQGGDVWTGTLVDGEGWLESDCEGFTVAAPDQNAVCGNATMADASWTDHLRPSCATALRLYCFQQ